MSISDSWLYSKDYEQSYRPTLFFTVQFVGGQEIYLTGANDLHAAGQYAGVTGPGGNAYGSVVINQQIGSLQSTSTQGIDAFGSISISVADADSRMWDYEAAFGFQGATLTATLMLFDPETGLTTPDSKVIFSGMCDPAQRNAQNQQLTITAVSNYALTKQLLPPMPISKNCPFAFPTTYAQRLDGANNPFSIYYNCGYSPDVSGGVGNFINGAPATSCNYTRATCTSYGLFGVGRFGGVEWTPPATWKGRSYTAGHTLQGVNNVNAQKWTQYVPLTFGTTTVNAICGTGVGDPNFTSGEYIVGYGGGGGFNTPANDIYTVGVQRVVANGLLVPRYDQTSDLLFRWYIQSTGDRAGNANRNAIYDGQGDPYGSMLVINPTVYQQVQASSTNMSVQVLVGPRAIATWSHDGINEFDFVRTSNTAWIVYEILRLARPDLYPLIDLQSVLNYSYICDGGVMYRSLQTGQMLQHARYKTSLTISQPVAASTIIEGLKIAGKLMIGRTQDGTKIKFVCKQTLADQQSTPIIGSNDRDTQYASVHADGSGGYGHAAYVFDESTYLKNSVRIMQDTVANTPTVLQATIQDEEDDYSPQTVTIADPNAYARIQQKTASTINAIGLANYDQAYRALKTRQAELFYGNPRGDSGGTWRIQLRSTHRVAHLNLGDLVLFSNKQLSIGPQWFRVEGILPAADFAQSDIVMRWHSDGNYLDSFGQQ